MPKKEKQLILILTVIYLASRLVNLTILPIFNDEAIYLHWAQIMRDTPEKFFSLWFDGKQPLGMWFFGFTMWIIGEPLLAGRIVSVLFGLATLLGIYFLGKELGGLKIAAVASLIYISAPLALFFDRMALMESMINAAGIWSLFIFEKLVKTKKLIWAFFLGLVLGGGFWIKSTAQIFSFLTLAYLLVNVFFKRGKFYLHSFGLVLIINLLVVFPYFFIKPFTHVFIKNREFVFSFTEILGFPFFVWFQNLTKILEIFSGYVSFLFVPILIFALGKILKEKKHEWNLIILWSLGSLIIVLLTAKNLDSRYLLFTTPFLFIISSFLIARFRILMLLLFLPSIFLSLILINWPQRFFTLFPDTGSFATDKYQYVTGWPSGYGIDDAVNLLKKEANKQNILVGVRQDSGNPEDAIWVYLGYYPGIKVIYLLQDDNFWQQLKTISDKTPVYYVSREGQLLNHEKDMIEINRFVKPEGKNYISIQRVK